MENMTNAIANGMENAAQAMNNTAETVAKKGILTKDNAIKAFAVIGVVSVAYHGFQLGKDLVKKFQNRDCKTDEEVELEND